MKRTIMIAAALSLAAVVNAAAQDTSSVRPKPLPKDTSKVTTSAGEIALPYQQNNLHGFALIRL